MKNVKIGIIGGGSIFTPELVDLINKETETFETVQILFLDINEERKNIVGQLCERILKKANSAITIKYVNTYEEAISGSDFVLIQFRVGGEDARIEDELLGKKYKIPFVETLTVCGIATFLRTYYELEKIAAIIKEKAPNAWVLDFANPAGLCTQALNQLGIEKVVGVCNCSTGMLSYIREKFNCKETDEIFLSWRGLNHLTVTDSIMINGEEKYQELVDNFKDFEGELPFEKELIQKIGFIPNPYFQYQFRRNSMIEKLQKKDKVRSKVVKEINHDLLEQYKDLDYVPEDLKKRGGYGYSKKVVEVMKSLLIGDDKVHYMITKNKGSIVELPYESFVECPCVVTKNNICPLACGKLPLAATSVIVPIKIYETLLILAAKERDVNKLYQAMMSNPLLCDHILVEALMKDILEENAVFLPKEMR